MGQVLLQGAGAATRTSVSLRPLDEGLAGSSLARYDAFTLEDGSQFSKSGRVVTE